MLSRLLRTSFLTGFLLTLVAATLLAAPTLWFWVSTEPEPTPTRILGPFEFSQIPGKVRVLKWGDDEGRRHGRFFADWDDRELHGEYDRGEPTGIWRVVDRESGEVVTEAFPSRWDGDSDELESVKLFGFALRLSHGEDSVFEIDGFPYRLSLDRSFLMVRKTEEGFWVSGGSIAGQRLEFEHTSRVLLRRDGTLDTLIDRVMRTEFDEQNAIIRQSIVVDDDHADEVFGPPWAHPVTGAMDWDESYPPRNGASR